MILGAEKTGLLIVGGYTSHSKGPSDKILQFNFNHQSNWEVRKERLQLAREGQSALAVEPGYVGCRKEEE